MDLPFYLLNLRLLLIVKGGVGPHLDSENTEFDKCLVENLNVTGIQELLFLSLTNRLSCFSNVTCKECNEMHKGNMHFFGCGVRYLQCAFELTVSTE